MMKILIYSSQEFEKNYFNKFNAGQHQLDFTADSLSLETVHKAKGYEGVCCFVADSLEENIILKLSELGIKLIALRSAGYDHVDMVAAKKCGMTVVRVPDYSPQAVAEFAVGLILALSRKILKAYIQGLEHNFKLEGLMGFNLNQKTIGIVGTGKIGMAFAQIISGFGCRILANDIAPNMSCHNLDISYVDFKDLLEQSDIVSLHCPLNPSTYHLFDHLEFSQMKKGALIVNTARGGVINTKALIKILKTGHLAGAALDVYEKEKGLFFIDHRKDMIQDEQFLELQKMPNVIVTPHQAFLTTEAISNITQMTIDNITAFENGKPIHQIL